MTFKSSCPGYIAYQVVDIEHDHTRTTILYGALSGHAETWYEYSVRTGMRSIHTFPPDFITILLRLVDCFITPAMVTKAQSSFDKVVYTMTVGVQAYVRELERISKHILLPIDEYTLHCRTVEAIPSSVRNHLIDLRGLCHQSWNGLRQSPNENASCSKEQPSMTPSLLPKDLWQPHQEPPCPKRSQQLLPNQ